MEQWKLCVPQSACFLNVAFANVAANLPATHPTSMFFLLKAVSERNFSCENSTLVYLYLKSSVQLFTTQFCLIYVTAPLFPGGFRKKTNSWCARIAVNLNVHIQKITLCSYGKTCDFFRGGYRSNAYFQLKNENVLIVISTFNFKKC